MFNWTNFDARKEAAWKFCDKMRGFTKTERQACMNSHQRAKEVYAKDYFYLQEDPKADHNFIPIPTTTEFRAYDPNIDVTKGDDLVVLLMPIDGVHLPLPSRFTKPVEDVWRCSWFPYDTLRTKRKTEKTKSKAKQQKPRKKPTK